MLNFALVCVFLPIPILLWLTAFTERKQLHRDIEREELYARTRGNKSWKRKILR